MPASWSGIVGHKPTHGLVPYTGAFPIEQTIDHVGPMTRTVSDAALVLNVIAGPDGLDPRQPRDLVPDDYVAALSRGAEGLRVGVLTEGFGLPNSEAAVDDAVRAAAETLRGAGLAVEDVSVPWHLHGMRIWDVIATEGAAAQMVDANGYGMNWQGLYDPEVIALLRGPVAPRRQPVLRDRQARPAGRAARHRHAPEPALRDGPQPRARAPGRLRRCAGPLRRAGPADHPHPSHGHPVRRRAARGGDRPRTGDDPEHLRHRRHRPPGVQRAGRARRTASRSG